MIEVGLLDVVVQVIDGNVQEVGDGGQHAPFVGDEELMQLRELLLNAQERAGNGVQFDLDITHEGKGTLATSSPGPPGQSCSRNAADPL